MNKLHVTMSLLLSAFAFTACVEPDTGGSTGRVIIEQPCAADADCPAGFECEIEDEHGVTTSFCQSHDGPEDEDGDGVCPAGYELEIEHGQAYCKPHGGDDGSGGGSGGGSDDGSGGGSDD